MWSTTAGGKKKWVRHVSFVISQSVMVWTAIWFEIWSLHHCLLFLRWQYELLYRMESVTMFPPVSWALYWALTSWSGLQVEVTPTAVCSTHCTSQAPSLATPVSLFPVFQVWCDVTKPQIVEGHFILVYAVWVGVLFCLFGATCLCQWFMAEDHMKWLTALA